MTETQENWFEVQQFQSAEIQGEVISITSPL